MMIIICRLTISKICKSDSLGKIPSEITICNHCSINTNTFYYNHRSLQTLIIKCDAITFTSKLRL